MNEERVRLLLVAGFFPPAGGVATFRATKFVRYLSRFGVETSVLAMSTDVYRQLRWPIDEGLMKQMPAETVIYRTGVARIPLMRDIGLLWTIQLCWSVHRVMRTARPDVVMITGDPFFPMMLGPVLRLCYGSDYILDFRDPWSLAERDPGSKTVKLRLVEVVSRLGEWFALRWCKRAIVVSEPMYINYTKRYVGMRQKFVTIPNGYDPVDYETALVDDRAKGAIVYTGKFRTGQRYRDPSALFHALKRLTREGICIQFTHIGAIEEDAVAAAEAAGLDSNSARWEGYLPHATTIAAVKQARIGVIIGGGQRCEQTTKVFDYVAAGVPILAIVPRDGNVASILESYPAAAVVDNDTDSIASGIRWLLQVQTRGPRTLVERFTREKLTEELSHVIKGCRFSSE